MITTYTTTITKSGQITLVKPLRDALQVKPGEKLRLEHDSTTGDTIIHRPASDFDEFVAGLEKVQSSLSPESRRRMKAIAGKTASQIKKEWATSPEGRAYYRKKYHLDPSSKLIIK